MSADYLESQRASKARTGDDLFCYLISFGRKPINCLSGPRVLRISGEL